MKIMNDDDENYEFRFLNCGVNSYMKEGHRSYIRIFEYLEAWTGGDYLINSNRLLAWNRLIYWNYLTVARATLHDRHIS